MWSNILCMNPRELCFALRQKRADMPQDRLWQYQQDREPKIKVEEEKVS